MNVEVFFLLLFFLRALDKLTLHSTRCNLLCKGRNPFTLSIDVKQQGSRPWGSTCRTVSTVNTHGLHCVDHLCSCSRQQRCTCYTLCKGLQSLTVVVGWKPLKILPPWCVAKRWTCDHFLPSKSHGWPVRELEKDDYIENVHVLSWFVLLKSVLLISCVFWNCEEG